MTGALLGAESERAVKQRVAALEASTGVEVVCAVIARADSYPEIPWKAFALGASLSALAMTAAALREPGWEAFNAVIETAVAVLAVGGAAALATVWCAPFARLFLPKSRRESEVLQYAQALFLESGPFGAARGNGVLLLVSLFERQVTVVADRGVREKVPSADLDSAVAAVTARLQHGQLESALVDGLARLEEVLRSRGHSPREGRSNEVADSVIQRGPA